MARVEDVGLSATGLSDACAERDFRGRGHIADSSSSGPPEAGSPAILDLLSVQALPLRGRVEVLGVDTAELALRERPRVRRRIGRLFQAQRLVPDLDVFANVALAARVARRRARDYGPDVERTLAVGWAGRPWVRSGVEADRERASSPVPCSCSGQSTRTSTRGRADVGFG